MKWQIFLLLGISFSAGLPRADRAHGAPSEFFDLADVRPGLRGVAHTVFEGDRSRAFAVEIVGVLAGTRPKGDLIIFRALGDSAAQIGVAAGMSGSPVYLDGRLLGAIAFAFPFSKEPIGMITPIGEMTEGLEHLEDPPGPWMGGSQARFAPALESFLAREQADPTVLRGPGGGLEGGESGGLVSLCGTGWAPELGPVLDSFARRNGWVVPPGGAPLQGRGGGEAVEPGPLDPGSADGVALVRGDATLAAIGTLTYRDGTRIAAFGHPLFHAGPVRLPLARAWIHGIVPSYASSFKMGGVTDLIGTVRQDLRAGIVGTLGDPPAMLPVRIDLEGPGGRGRFRYELARGVALEPSLLAWTLSNSLLQHGYRVGDLTIDAEVQLHYNGGAELRRRDRLSTRAPASETAARLLAGVSALLSNPFEPVVLESVAVVIRQRPVYQETSLADLWAERERVKPGEPLLLRAKLRDRHGSLREIPITVAIPERWRGQTLLILAGGGQELSDWDRERAPGLYEPQDLAGLARMIREYPDAGDLLVRIYSEQEGLLLGNREFGPLPQSVARVLDSKHKRGLARPAPNFLLEERRIDAGAPVRGGMAVRVRIE